MPLKTEPDSSPGIDEPASEQRRVSASTEFALLYRQATIALREGELYLGRSSDCELAIADPAVSRRHARLSVRGLELTIEDLSSVNGVYVNGRRIESPTPLRLGDEIRVSHHALEVVAARPAAPTSQRYHVSAHSLTSSERATLVDDLRPSSSPPPRDSVQNLRLRSTPPPERASRPSTRPPARTTRPGADAPIAAESRPSNSAPASRVERSPSSARVEALTAAAVELEAALRRGAESEVERRLAPILMQVHDLLLESRVSASDLVERLVSSAAELAAQTRNPVWMNYSVTLYALLQRPLPAAAIDAIELLVEDGAPPNMGALDDYLGLLLARRAELDGHGRALLERLLGVLRPE